MILRIRKRRLLAPILLGSLLTVGCQSTGSGAGRPSLLGGSADKSAQRADTQTAAVGGAVGQGQNAGLDRPPADNTTVAQDTQGREATSVTYIPPGAARGGAPSPTDGTTSPYSVVRRTAGPAGANPADGPGRLMTPPPGGNTVDATAEMTMKAPGTGSEMKSLEARMQQLEQRLEQRDQAVRQSSQEVLAATEELKRTHGYIEGLRKEVEETRARMNNRDAEDVAALQAQVKVLERLAGEESPPPAGK